MLKEGKRGERVKEVRQQQYNGMHRLLALQIQVIICTVQWEEWRDDFH